MKDYLKRLLDFQGLFRAENIKYFNLILFISCALNGYFQYFFRQIPPEKSLVIGLGFTAITGFYLILLKLRT
jgi:hypothetical protein